MNILFVCTGNTCRSAMAAAIMDKIAAMRDLDIAIESAGTMAFNGERAGENAVTVLKKHGIDLSSHRSQSVTEELIGMSDLILTMTKPQKDAVAPLAGDKVYTLSEYVGRSGDIPDPFGGGEEVYENCANALYTLLELLADKLEDKG